MYAAAAAVPFGSLLIFLCACLIKSIRHTEMMPSHPKAKMRPCCSILMYSFFLVPSSPLWHLAMMTRCSVVFSNSCDGGGGGHIIYTSTQRTYTHIGGKCNKHWAPSALILFPRKLPEEVCSRSGVIVQFPTSAAMITVISRVYRAASIMYR